MKVKVTSIYSHLDGSISARLNGELIRLSVSNPVREYDIPEPPAKLIRTIVYEGPRELIEKQTDRGYLNPGMGRSGYGGIIICERARVWEE